MTPEELKELLSKKWSELESGDNPDSQWNAYLNKLGLVKHVTGDFHWHPESGVLPAIDRLTDLINSDDKLFAVPDPSGAADVSILVFSRSSLATYSA